MKLKKCSRRQFVKGTALAVTAPLIVPASVFGKLSPSNTLNVGIVGCGDRFSAHSGSLNRIPGVRVTAVCDIWTERAKNAKATIDGMNKDTNCKEYHDFREMIRSADIDIVTVAAPDHWHALVAIEAAKAGKHIYLEKPFAYSVEEGRAVVDAVNKSGVILQHGTQQRSMTHFQRAAYCVREGLIGDVDVVYAISPYGPQGGDMTESAPPDGYDFDLFTGPAPKIPFYKELAIRQGTSGWYFTSIFGGGWVTAWGSHHVDSAVSALGKDHEAPVKVEAKGSYPAQGAWDTAYEWNAEFTYADGKKLVYCTPKYAPPAGGNVIAVGSRGWVSAWRGGMRCNPGNLWTTPWPRGDREFPNIYDGARGDHFYNFIAAIRYGEKLMAPKEIGHLTTKLCHLTNIGIEVQRPLQWDDKQERFVNDDQANMLLGRPMRAPWRVS